MTDIILINPGDRIQTYQSLGKDIAAIEPPTFLLIMAAYLRNKGYSVKIYDLPAETKSEDEMKNWKAERLLRGETFKTSEKGNSMVPLIKSGQEHILAPAKWEDCEVGDIVYCKVSGRFYTHLVKAKQENKGLLIGNNRGRINGWTKNVLGKVIEIL